MRVKVRATTNSSAGAGGSATNPQTGSVSASRKNEGTPVVRPFGNISRQGVFQSVLTKPFRLWNNIEEIIAEFLSEWSPSQRSCLIQNVLRFLELKVIMEEYEPNKLLAPTQLVAHAWHVLILQTGLYRDVTFAIQDFHARPRRMIHHALLSRSEKNAYQERLERTQRLFQSYYQSQMPSELAEIDGGNQQSLSVWGKDEKKSTLKDTSSIVSGRDEAPSSEKDGSGKSRETRKSNEADNHQWYFPWMPTCGCLTLSIGDAFCSKEDMTCPSDDIFEVKEDVSLLTPPDSVIEE